MQNLIHRTLLLTISASALVGCQYDRSFMQMDSNSGAPFLGLQWSVDSGTRPADAASQKSELENSSRLEFSDRNIPDQANTQNVSARSTSTTARFETGSFFRNRQDDSIANLRLSDF